MNPSPSAAAWCNPPPPGTDEDLSNSSLKESPSRAIDRIDPFLKSAEYLKYERRRRSRSRSRHRRHRSRSRTRHKHRRRSRSRSRRRHKRRSRSRRRSRRRRTPTPPKLQPPEPQVDPEDDEDDDEEEEEPSNENMFKNDGTFMEMFKRMQEEQKKEQEAAAAESKAPMPMFGKRRGGKVLKTGMVQKTKTMTQEESDAQDAWTLYMKEVKRYKEACCDDDSKTRLLVK